MGDAADDIVSGLATLQPSKISSTRSKSSLNSEDGGYIDRLPTYRQPQPERPPNTKRQSNGTMNMLHDHLDSGIEAYFVGPRDLDGHSKLPFFMRMHGSVLPKLVVPLLLIGCWATLITCITKFEHNLGISNILLTVLGFVVGLALSFRSSTAYERYAEGRKAWGQLTLTSRTFARLIWIHIREREEDPEIQKQDILAKLSAINLIRAFALAVKHKLRFEPYAHYDDIIGHIGHLDTFAKEAYCEELLEPAKKTPWKAAGEFLGIPFAESNPRKALKRAKKPIGNLPLEILNYLSAYVEDTMRNGTAGPILQGQLFLQLASMGEVLTTVERVLNTPLPAAYSIAIAQITLIYVFTLPFQLVEPLGWIAIPGTIAGAYIILGLAAIGQEIENPFGHDVNDLPLSRYCEEISLELDIMTATPPPESSRYMRQKDNLVLYPLSMSGHDVWEKRTIDDIRDALKAKTVASIHRKSVRDFEFDSFGNIIATHQNAKERDDKGKGRSEPSQANLIEL